MSPELRRWLLRGGVGLAFREVAIAGAQRLPRTGSVILVGPASPLHATLVEATAPAPVRWVHLTSRFDRGTADADRHPSLQALDQALVHGGLVGVLPRAERDEPAESARRLAAVVRAASRAVRGGQTVWLVASSVTVVARRRGFPRLLVRFATPIAVQPGAGGTGAAPLDAAVALDAALAHLHVAPASWDSVLFQASLHELVDGGTGVDTAAARAAFVASYARLADEPDVREARRSFSEWHDRTLAIGGDGGTTGGLLARRALLTALLPLQALGGALLAPLRYGTSQALFGMFPKLGLGAGVGATAGLAAALLWLGLRHPWLGALGLAAGVVAGVGVVERRCVSLSRLVRQLRKSWTAARAREDLFVQRLAVAQQTSDAVRRTRPADHGRLFPVGSAEFDVRGSSVLSAADRVR